MSQNKYLSHYKVWFSILIPWLWFVTTVNIACPNALFDPFSVHLFINTIMVNLINSTIANNVFFSSHDWCSNNFDTMISWNKDFTCTHINLTSFNKCWSCFRKWIVTGSVRKIPTFASITIDCCLWKFHFPMKFFTLLVKLNISKTYPWPVSSPLEAVHCDIVQKWTSKKWSRYCWEDDGSWK